jgi:hypothetical protein
MELELLREYFPQGTNGEIWHDGKLICKTIELPWKENAKKISCIPEGRYSLIIKWHKKHGWVLVLQEVTNRKGILLHPANNALKELKGCIAPVMNTISAGNGTKSKPALKALLKLVLEVEEEEGIYLTIAEVDHPEVDHPELDQRTIQEK